MANKPIDSAYLKDQVLKFKSSVLDPILNNKQEKLTFDTKPVANSLNPVTSGGLFKSIDALQTAIAATEGASKKVPANTDINTVFYSGYNSSTVECQSLLNCPAAWYTLGIGEMSIKYIPEATPAADGSSSYGTQVLYGERTDGTVGEWRRVWAGAWTPWKTIVDPMDTYGFVDLSSKLTYTSLVSNVTVEVARNKGLLVFFIQFKYNGNKTIGTQSSVIKGIPAEYRPSLTTTFYASGYMSTGGGSVAGANLSINQDGSISIHEIGIDNTGLIKDTVVLVA